MFARAGRSFLVVLLLAMVVSGAGSDRTLHRTADPVVVTGAPLAPLAGWTIAGTRAFAFAGSDAHAIPFQIDERDAKGEYALPFGDKRSADDGKIDANDELVFMVKDCGQAGAAASLPPGWDAAAEVAVTDPIDGGQAWLYLAHYAQNPPAPSDVDYVSYDNAKVAIDTTQFRMVFHPQARLSIGDLILKPAGGGTGLDLVDRLKIRFEARILGVDLLRDEENFLSETVGWIDGPVRIVRHTINRVVLWKIKSPKAYTDNVYYVNAFEFPTIVELPFGSELLVDNPRFRVSTDGMCTTKGRVFYNSNNPDGVAIDGVMSDAETRLDHSPYIWSAITDPQGRGAWMNRLLYDATATPVKPQLYYVDDMATPDPPEDEPGHCGDVGYTLENLGQLKRDKLYLKSILYNMPDYSPARVREFMNIIDRPVRVAIRALPRT